jgi:hypothetical protein
MSGPTLARFAAGSIAGRPAVLRPSTGLRRGKAPVMQGDGRIDQVDCGLSK